MTDLVYIDLETRSPVNLKTAGSWTYAEHPQTSLLTCAWDIDGVKGLWLPTIKSLSDPIKQLHLRDVDTYYGPNVPQPILDNLRRTFCGHNVETFDKLVWEKRYPAPAAWKDTYPLALSHGFPGSLDACGARLGLGGKDKVGQSRLHQYTRNFAKIPQLMDVVLIGKYNQHDVTMTKALDHYINTCPKQPEWERQVLETHKVINARGIRVDVGMMRAIRDLSVFSVDESLREIDKLTGGDIPDLAALNKRNTVIAWLEEQKIDVQKELKGKKVGSVSIAKNSVAQWLDRLDYGMDVSIDELVSEGDFTAKAVKLLQLRSSALRVTGGKIEAGISACTNGHLKGMLAYWGAHTGRWAGRGINLCNLPRPLASVPVWDLVDLYLSSDSKLPVDRVNELLDKQFAKLQRESQPGDTPIKRATLDEAASALLRTMVIPEDGYMLAMADFSSVECRGVNWLADNADLMDIFWKDGDPYSVIASKLFGVPVSKKVNKHYRHVGKTIELGCGFGMGAKRFREYGAIEGIDFEALGITPQQCIDLYRGTHEAVAGVVVGEYNGVPYRRDGLWHKYSEAAKEATQYGMVKVGPVVFKHDGKHLRVKLPSGRFLTYPNAKVEMDQIKGDDGSYYEVECVMFTNTRGHRTGQSPGTWAENVTQAMCRDPLATTLVKCEAEGIRTPLHVYDEVVAVVKDVGQFHRFMQLMTMPPDWLPGFPLDAEGGVLPRYHKSVRPENSEIEYRNGSFKKGEVSKIWPVK